MALDFAKSFQFLWAVFFALMAVPPVPNRPSSGRILEAVLAVVLLLAAIGCRQGLRWCWIPAVSVGVVQICRMLPMVAHNFYMMNWLDDPLFHESPGHWSRRDVYRRHVRCRTRDCDSLPGSGSHRNAAPTSGQYCRLIHDVPAILPIRRPG
jgi:hypothetical protein